MATSEKKTRYSYTITDKTDKTVADAITDGVNDEGSFPKLVNGLLYRCWAYEGDERAAKVRDAVEYLANKSINLGGNDDAENVFRKMLDTMDKESGYSNIPEALRPKIPEMTIDEHTLIEMRDDIIDTIGKVLNNKVIAAGGDTHELELINANKALTANQDIMDRLNALMEVVNKYDATGETTLHMLSTIKKAAIDISGKASLEIAKNKKIIDADKKAKEAERKRLAALEAEAKRQADEAEAIARKKRLEAEQAAMKRKLAEEAKARQLERERLEKERVAQKLEEEKLAKARNEQKEKEHMMREEAKRIAKQNETSHRKSFTEEFAAINNTSKKNDDSNEELDDDLLSFLIGAVNDPGFVNGKLGVDDENTAISEPYMPNIHENSFEEDPITNNDDDDINNILDDLGMTYDSRNTDSTMTIDDDIELGALPDIENESDDDKNDNVINDFDDIDTIDLFDEDEQDTPIIETPKTSVKHNAISNKNNDAFKNTDTMSFTAMFCKTGDDDDEDEHSVPDMNTNINETERIKHRKSHAKSGKSYLYEDYSDRSFAPADMNIETWKPSTKNGSLFD